MYRVLIVEDEIIVRMWLKKQVKWEACGFEIVAEAGNGRDALELFRNNKIDLVLTDIRMPVMDGIELLQRIRQEDARVRFLILTCLDEFSLVKQAMALARRYSSAVGNSPANPPISNPQNSTPDNPALRPAVSCDLSSLHVLS